MKELSLNILDIAENSVKAGATLTEITVEENGDRLVLTIKDDGCGMTNEILKSVTDPFYTTRTTRKVGMGIPLLKLAAEQTGGELQIDSRCEKDYPENHGTSVKYKCRNVLRQQNIRYHRHRRSRKLNKGCFNRR